jgi:LL-diaminopimelate aminotransferase
MTNLNPKVFNLKSNQLIEKIEERVAVYKNLFPTKKLARLDNLEPNLPFKKAVAENLIHTLENLCDEQAFATIKYDILEEKLLELIQSYYQSFKVEPEISEIFLHQNTTQEIFNLLNLFSKETTIAVCTPTTGVYGQLASLAGLTGEINSSQKYYQLTYLKNEEVTFLPIPPEERVDLVFLDLISPITGLALTKHELQKWIDWAIVHKSVLICNSSLAFYNQNSEFASSIYELDGTKNCCIEIFSSKQITGFGGLDLGFCVIPENLKIENSEENESLNKAQKLQSSSLGNQPSLLALTQGLAIFSKNGLESIDLENQEIIKTTNELKTWLIEQKLEFVGGENSPFFWVKVPSQYADDWDFFEFLMREYQLVCRPGSCIDLGFTGYVFMSGFKQI